MLGAPQFSEEQIQEISKHDAVLAEQIRKARDAGVKMGWRDLEDIPVTHTPQYWPKEGGPPQALGSQAAKSKEGLLAITEGAKKDAQKLWETVKSSWSKIGTKMGKK